MSVLPVNKAKHRLLVLGSGSGSNARRLCQQFEHHSDISIVALGSNKPELGFQLISADFELPLLLVQKPQLLSTRWFAKVNEAFAPTAVILAGFLLQIPAHWIKRFPRHIINLHPALLPKFGGKGMYGLHVHRAVLAANEKQSGITIHLANEHYDQGHILAQFTCQVFAYDKPETLAKRIQLLEHTHFASTIEQYLLKDAH